MRILLLLCLCSVWTSCSMPHREVVRFRDKEGKPLANFPVRVELDDSLSLAQVYKSSDSSDQLEVVNYMPEDTRVLDSSTFETATDPGGNLDITYFDHEYDEYVEKNTGWRSMFNRGDLPPVRRVTIVPLKSLPAGSRIEVPTSHVKHSSGRDTVFKPTTMDD